MSSTLPVEFLIAGACYDGDSNTFLSCALQPLDCKSGSNFVSPLWLASNDPDIDCSSQESVRSILALGRCNNDSDEYLCTSDRSACRQKSSFHRTKDCTLHQDSSISPNNFDKAMFGRCHHNRNPGRDWCAWKSSECSTDDNNFNFGIAHPDAVHPAWESCECKDVHVGACVNANEETRYCAITADACTTELDYTYMPALDFQREQRSSCRLCDSTIITTTTNPPTNSPTVVPNNMIPTTSAITIPKNSMNNNNNFGSNNNKLSTGAVVGIVVGVVAVAIIIIGRVIMVTNKRTNNTKQSSSTVVTANDDKTTRVDNNNKAQEKARDFV